MKVEFDKSFLKSLEKIKDSKTLQKIEKAIVKCEAVNSLYDIQNIKKLSGVTNYFRIKLGNYRIGFELINKKTIRLIVITHRKDIYKKFP